MTAEAHGVPAVSVSQIPDKPVDSTVYDPSDYLSAETEEHINKLNDGWAAGKERFQMGVVVVDSLAGDLEETSLAIARKWEIGFGDTNRGALLLVAVDDREYRIETSDEVSTVVTDSIARQIQDDAKEELRAEDYDGAVTEMVERVGSYYTTGELPENTGDDDASDVFLILVFVVIILIAGMIDGGFGGGPFRGHIGSGSSGRGSSGGSSGGGGSWGGGGFSGGGSSSSW
jgi:uncharacterized membrane protein YgcG